MVLGGVRVVTLATSGRCSEVPVSGTPADQSAPKPLLHTKDEINFFY